jgi:hypothetical protein
MIAWGGGADSLRWIAVQVLMTGPFDVQSKR